MSDETDQAAQAMRTIWQGVPGKMDELDEECNPNKACRNMKDVTFDGYAEEGGDVRAAWRNTLAREGKLGSGSLADLVFGKNS